MTDLRASVHTLVDSIAADMHGRVDEIFDRHGVHEARSSRVCIDPGHGGRDPGASTAGVNEKDVVLRYSLELASILEERGHETLLTRDADVDLAPDEEDWGRGKGIDLRARSKLANEWAADCFVSIHANASSSDRADGAWVIHDDQSTRGPDLARSVFRELATVPGVPDDDRDEEVFADGTAWVGHRQLSVLGRTRMPAILVELGFLTNADDLAQLQDPEQQTLICRAIARGVERWLAREQRVKRS